jgi:hypothetical protein
VRLTSARDNIWSRSQPYALFDQNARWHLGNFEMALSNWFKSLLGSDVAVPDRKRLKATSEADLSSALGQLPIGETGWIALHDAQKLFSSMGAEYAFGEMDEQGRANLAAFASTPRHRSTFDIMPTEGRVYFTRSGG